MTWQELSILDLAQLFTELDSKIVIYKPDSNKWLCFPIVEDAVKDWSKCLFDKSINPSNNEGLSIFFVHLQSSYSGKYHRSNTISLDFLRYLRLSNYHPKSQNISDYKLWGFPVVCFSFESRESILARHPEALVLFSPSVKFQRLPFIFSNWDNWLEEIKKLKPATENELPNYINSTIPVNLSSHHYLGNLIGPYAILNAIKPIINQPLTFEANSSFNTRILHEIFWQSKQSNGSDEEISFDLDKIRKLKEEIETKATESQKTPLLIIDDNLIENENIAWRIVWASLTGLKTWARLDKNSLLAIIQTVNLGNYNEGFFNDIKKYSLIILDLRLEPEKDKNKQLEDISGYKALKYIRKYDEAIPILVFTSSQRATILQSLKAAGADAVLVKPTRFDTALILVENLTKEITHLLSPQYKLLRDIYYDLKKQESNSLGSKKAIPVQWALDAWREARHNVRNWIEHPEEKTSRLSAISVARTAGLAEESVDNAVRLYHPYKTIAFGFRNCASHFGITQTVSTDVGYLAIWFIAKLLSVADNELSSFDLSLSHVIIELFNYKWHGRNLPSALTIEIRGALQIGTLVITVNQHITSLSCEHIKEYLISLEKTAKDFIINECKGKITINPGDLQPLADITEFSHLRPWLIELENQLI